MASIPIASTEDHNDPLYSKYRLGRSLYKQGKRSEAEEIFQQAIEGREKTLGKDHQDTLDSKYWLGCSLYKQGKHSEVEDLFQQTVEGREKILGKDHQDTLNSKYWLGRSPSLQGKRRKAEGLLQQVAERQERTPGKGDEDTPATACSIQDLQLGSSSPLPFSDTTQHILAGCLNRFFAEGRDSLEPYTDSEINEISMLLKHSNPRWSRLPRTYIVLRKIGHLNVLESLIDIGFSDYWFPVTERSLPDYLRPSVRSEVVRIQSVILTKSMGLEKGEERQHCYFKQGESLPFEQKGILGSGAYGQVDKVLSLVSFKEYARKRVLRSTAFKGRRAEEIKQFIAEIEILKRLKHHHIVEFVGSYTDHKYFGLIMTPIAEMDLRTYLTRATVAHYPELRTFFGCLARALEFLHARKVRHKDIKPANILVHYGNVLFADFGLSLDFADASGSTTMSMVNGMTPRYCAPEVAQYEPRNTMSDIWSLGVVFMEMIVALKGSTVQLMDQFLSQHGSQQTHIRSNFDALSDFVIELEGIGEPISNQALRWTQQMLLVRHQSRPTASSLVASIAVASQTGERVSFCGVCCAPDEEEFSD